MISALRGRGVSSKADIVSNRLREFADKGEEGVKKSENFAYVILGIPLIFIYSLDMVDVTQEME